MFDQLFEQFVSCPKCPTECPPEKVCEDNNTVWIVSIVILTLIIIALGTVIMTNK